MCIVGFCLNSVWRVMIIVFIEIVGGYIFMGFFFWRICGVKNFNGWLVRRVLILGG